MTDKVEMLCTECGSVFWFDPEVIAVNNTTEIWCPYCRDNTGLTIQDLKRYREKYKDKYGWSSNR